MNKDCKNSHELFLFKALKCKIINIYIFLDYFKTKKQFITFPEKIVFYFKCATRGYTIKNYILKINLRKKADFQ